MFVRRLDNRLSGGIYDWLLENKDAVLAGSAEYMGTPVTDSTEFYQYEYVISVPFIISFCCETPPLLPAAENGYLRFERWKYAAITLLLGWWCFPWGPFCSISALFCVLSGGEKRTAASLLQLIEWGWEAPEDASLRDYSRRILEISPLAAAEIRSRMAKGGFSEELAVRVTPIEFTDSEVEIAFDYPVFDERDWLDKSDGLLLLIDREYESQLSGCQIEFFNGKFYAVTAAGRDA